MFRPRKEKTKYGNSCLAKVRPCSFYGGIVTEVWVSDKKVKPGDVVVGFENLYCCLDLLAREVVWRAY